MNRTFSHRLILILGAITGGFAIALQCYLILLNRIESVPETIIRFFSYFTILTNILVALYFTVLALNRNTRIFRWLLQPGVSTAIVVYITVVGLVYQILLRHLWSPAGLQLIADELLHSVIPLYAVFYWSKFSEKHMLQWNEIPGWLFYPFCYVVFILFRGSLSGFYPYPFVAVSSIGYGKVILNCGGLFIGFILISVVFIAISKSSGSGDKF